MERVFSVAESHSLIEKYKKNIVGILPSNGSLKPCGTAFFISENNLLTHAHVLLDGGYIDKSLNFCIDSHNEIEIGIRLYQEGKGYIGDANPIFWTLCDNDVAILQVQIRFHLYTHNVRVNLGSLHRNYHIYVIGYAIQQTQCNPVECDFGPLQTTKISELKKKELTTISMVQSNEQQLIKLLPLKNTFENIPIQPGLSGSPLIQLIDDKIIVSGMCWADAKVLRKGKQYEDFHTAKDVVTQKLVGGWGFRLTEILSFFQSQTSLKENPKLKPIYKIFENFHQFIYTYADEDEAISSPELNLINAQLELIRKEQQSMTSLLQTLNEKSTQQMIQNEEKQVFQLENVAHSYKSHFVQTLTMLVPLIIPETMEGFGTNRFDSIPKTTIDQVNQRLSVISSASFKQTNSLTQGIDSFFNLNSDWWSQRLCFLVANFKKFINKWDIALKFYEALETHEPLFNSEINEFAYNKQTLLINKAGALGFLGKLEVALETINQAIATHPKNFHALHNKGIVYTFMNNYKEAFNSYFQVLTINSDYRNTWLNIFLIIISSQLPKIINQLSDFIEDILKKNPSHIYALLIKSMILLQSGKNKDAENLIERATSLQPTDNYMLILIMIMYRNIGKKKKTLFYTDKLFNDDLWDRIILIECIVSYRKFWEHDKALELIDKRLALHPEDVNFLLQKANLFDSMDKYGDALAIAEKLVDLEPKQPTYWNKKGVSLFYLNRLEEAIVSYNEATKLFPEYGTAWANKASAFYSLGKMNDAMAFIEQALRIKPNSSFNWKIKASILNSMNKKKEAKEALKEAKKYLDIGITIPKWR